MRDVVRTGPTGKTNRAKSDFVQAHFWLRRDQVKRLDEWSAKLDVSRTEILRLVIDRVDNSTLTMTVSDRNRDFLLRQKMIAHLRDADISMRRAMTLLNQIAHAFNSLNQTGKLPVPVAGLAPKLNAIFEELHVTRRDLQEVRQK